MPIQSKVSAKQLWKMFYKKYTHPAEVIKFPFPYKKKFSEFERSNFIDSLTIKGMTSKEIEAKTKKMQSLRRQKGKNGGQISQLNVSNKNYNSKLNALLLALNEGDLSNKIFRDKKITQLSWSLYQANKISYQQLSSVLQRPQIKTTKDGRIYAILDQNGEFSKEAQEILLPELKNTYFLAAPTEEQLKEFKLLILTLPKSEQFFYCLSSTHHESTLKPKPRGILSHSFAIIHLTVGARDALGLVHFGLDDYIPAKSRLINLGVHDASETVRILKVR